MPFILSRITKFFIEIGLDLASDTNIITLIMIILGMIVYYIN